MRIGVSLPVRELRDDLGAIREFAHVAEALGVDFRTHGRRCSEQMALLRRLWTEEEVFFEGEFHRVNRVGIDPLPIQRPIPQWIGGASVPSEPVLRRIRENADGWCALCAPEQVADLRARIDAYAEAAGRDPADIGAESGLGIHGRTQAEWLDILAARRATGITHLCMRTLGGELDAKGHLDALRGIHRVLRDEGLVA